MIDVADRVITGRLMPAARRGECNFSAGSYSHLRYQ